MPDIILPVVHLNGTSKSRLIDDLSEAYYALGKAYDAIKQTAPNGRDYYLVPGLLDKATEQHRKRLLAVDALREEISLQMVGISSQ